MNEATKMENGKFPQDQEEGFVLQCCFSLKKTNALFKCKNTPYDVTD